MTVQDAGFMKLKAQFEIELILKNLMEFTGCKVVAVGLVIEEGFAAEPVVITHVEVKLEII
jgi:hypothetical protein